MALYHHEVYIPTNIKLPTGAYSLTYSQHARQAARSDRYGHIPLPAYIDTSKAMLIEVEIENGKILKILYRSQLNDKLDVCIVVIPGRWFVKTLWINESSDKHFTLNRNKYATR